MRISQMRTQEPLKVTEADLSSEPAVPIFRKRIQEEPSQMRTEAAAEVPRESKWGDTSVDLNPQTL